MHEFLAVDLLQYIFERTSKSGVCVRFDVRLRQLKPASSGPLSDRSLRGLPRRSLAYPTLRPVSLQPSLDGVQELERGAAVEYAVVEGDLQVHHAAYSDGVVYDDGTLDDRFCREDRRLRMIDNRRRDHASQ